MTDDTSIFTLKSVYSLFNQLETEYQVKIKILRDIFPRVETILKDNRISIDVLADMTLFVVSNQHISYQTESGKYKFIIDYHITSPATDSYIVITLKNLASNNIKQEKFIIYKTESTLTPQFTLLFRNAFSNYYQS